MHSVQHRLRLVLVLGLLLGPSLLPAQSAAEPEFQWIEYFGSIFSYDDDTEDEWGQDLAVDDSGNVYVIGQIGEGAVLQGDTLPHYDDLDVLIAKFNCRGQLQWRRVIGAPLNDGNQVALSLGPNNDLVVAMSINVNHYIGDKVSMRDTTYNPVSGYETLIASYDKGSGARNWFTTSAYGKTGDKSPKDADCLVKDLAVTPSNQIFVLVFHHHLAFDSLFLAHNNQIRLARDATYGFNYSLVELDTNGTIQQGVPLYVPDDTTFNNRVSDPMGLHSDDSGNLYVSGNFGGDSLQFLGPEYRSAYGATDPFILKLSGQGQKRWLRHVHAPIDPQIIPTALFGRDLHPVGDKFLYFSFFFLKLQ